ncbi:MAG: GNAT family N-acetyltransferase [Myxococcota bacterium]
MIVRPVTVEDRAEWVRASEVSRAFHAPWSPLWPEGATAEDLFAVQLSRQLQGTCLKCVAVADDGRIAGWFNLNDVVRSASMCATAGWSVNVEFAGRGVATEGVRQLLGLAFGPLGLHRVACGIMPRNARSLRVAEKNGFRREGYAVKAVQVAGEWEDHVLFAKLAEEHGV